MYSAQSNYDYVNSLGSLYGFDPNSFRVNKERPTYGSPNWTAPEGIVDPADYQTINVGSAPTQGSLYTGNSTSNVNGPNYNGAVGNPNGYTLYPTTGSTTGSTSGSTSQGQAGTVYQPQSTGTAQPYNQNGTNLYNMYEGWKPPANDMTNPSYGYNTPPEGYGTIGQTPSTSAGGSTRPWQDAGSVYQPPTEQQSTPGGRQTSYASSDYINSLNNMRGNYTDPYDSARLDRYIQRAQRPLGNSAFGALKSPQELATTISKNAARREQFSDYY